MGAWTFKAGYVGVSSSLAGKNANKFGLGVQYDLSKRTNIYSNIGDAGGDRVSGTQGDMRFDIGVTHKF
jgi:predicted porin